MKEFFIKVDCTEVASILKDYKYEIDKNKTRKRKVSFSSKNDSETNK